jgi:spermidine/putrescine transport system substrate-binding protein
MRSGSFRLLKTPGFVRALEIRTRPGYKSGMTRLVLAMLACWCCAVAYGANNKLNLFIWSEYIDPEIVSEFERRFDCKVTMDFYEDEAGMMSRLQGGGSGQYDVVVPPEHIVPALRKLKLIAPLRKENIPNMRHIDERFAKPWYDPTNDFTVPYQWGTVGIYVRKQDDKPVEESWAILFDAKQQPGAFVLMDSMRDCLGAALKYKGYSLNSTVPSELAQARDLLIAAKRRAVGFEGGVGGKNKVLSKQAAACIAYSGDAIRGMKEDKDTYYFIPKEGSQIWVDNLAVCAKAPNRVVAERFLNFILDPKISARLADYNQYATPVKPALEFVHANNRENRAIYPDRETMERLETMKDLGPATRLYDEVWTQVKAR